MILLQSLLIVMLIISSCQSNYTAGEATPQAAITKTPEQL